MDERAAQWWTELLLVTPIYIYAMVRPAVFWRMRFALTRWAHPGRKAPPPSGSGLWAVRAVVTLVYALIVASVIQRAVA